MQNVKMIIMGIAFLATALFTVSCSGDDSENEQKKFLENATWHQLPVCRIIRVLLL